jgi:hypothetical protein
LQKILADDQVSFATPSLGERKTKTETAESKHRRFAQHNTLTESDL